MKIGYAVRDCTMVLDRETTNVLDGFGPEAIAVEIDLRADAKILARSLGHAITIVTADGAIVGSEVQP
jgi:hypothetical protein